MRKLRKPLSWLLAVCMLFSLLPGTALAADPDPAPVADTTTYTDWEDLFGVGGSAYLTTKDIGRIWTDKSVSTQDITLPGPVITGLTNNTVEKEAVADFLVALSGLGSAATIVDRVSVPIDTVLILDMSPKMGDPDAKAEAMLTATESAIRTLMAANPNNRVAVIGYSDYASVLLPLDHYQNGAQADYFNYNPNTIGTGGKVTAYGINSSTNPVENTFDIDRQSSGTDKYTQSGIYLGAQQLLNAGTTVRVGGAQVDRAPQIILLSEGEPKDGDTNITAPPTTNSNNIQKFVVGDGAGSDESRHAQSFAMMMTAAYVKGQVADHYAHDGAFITIGVNPGSADAPNLARLCLNPKGELSSNTHANDFNNYFNEYKTTTSVDIMRYGGGASRTDRVTFNNFPASVTSLAYNDAYYEVTDVDNAEAWKEIFDEIANDIATQAPTSPTETPEGAPGTGGESGFITFTDELGPYMKVVGAPTVLYGDHAVKATTSDNGATYTFTGTVEGNEIYGAADLSDLELTVTPGGDTQTLTWKVPASLIPLRTVTAESATNALGETTHTIQQNQEAYPIRLFYSVDWDETVTFDQDDNDYLIAHSKDGTTSFYSNAWDAAAKDDAQYGTATAVFTPAASNAFYHYTEDTPLYVLVDNVAGGSQKLLTHQEALEHLLQSTVIPERGTVVIDGTTYNIVRAQEAHKGQGAAFFYEHRYYQAQDTGDTGELDADLLTDYHLVLNPRALQGHVVDDAGGLSIKEGSAKLSRVSDGNAAKTGNTTGTAVHYRHPVYNVDDTKVTVHLGNNGLRTEKTPTGTLTVKVNTTTGSSAPSSEPTFTYTLELYNVSPEGTANGKLDTQKAPVTVKIGDGSETPLNSDGTFQLQPGQTATVSGIPAGTAYQLTETAIAGYEDTYQNSYPGYTTTPQGRVVYDSTGDIAASVTVSHAYDPSQRSFTLTYNGNAVQGSVTNVPSAQPNITGGTQVTLAGGPTHSAVGSVAVAFIGWTDATNKTTTILSANDTAPTTVLSPYTVNADTTLYAAWGYDEDGNGEPDVTETQYTVTARVEGEGGSIDPTSKTVNAGEDVEFTIDAKDGYALDTIQVNSKTEYTNDDITAPFEGTWTLENVQEAAEVVVTFGEDENDNGVPDDKEEPEEEQYTVTASSDNEEQGSIDPTEATVDAGDDLPFTIHAEDGCALDYITVNGDVVYSNNDPENAFTGSWTLEDIREDSEVVAYFGADEDEDGVPDEPSYWTIEASAGSGGGIDPEGDVFVPDGGDQRFDFDPDRGYEIDRVRVDGDSERVRSSYTFEEVTENHTIRVTFTETDEGGDDDDDDDDDGGITYLTITATAGEGGSISPDGRVQVAYDRNKSFIIQADEGYELADVLVDGRSVGAVGRYTFEKVHKNHTITAVFTASQKLNGVDRWLNTRDHIAYLSGYPDGTFGPDRNMTRAEVAQMFYALLNDQNVPATVSFSDVPDGAWYADAVETLASLGMFTGYPDGTFHPNSTITRAEFAAAALSFADMAPSARCSFPDVSAQDWFYPYVASAAEYGWIGGYPDGTFRPSGSITRAEVAVIVNHMLGRTPDQSFVDRSLDRLVSFSDLNSSHWAFYPIMEASNSHGHIKAGGSEQWTGINN